MPWSTKRMNSAGEPNRKIAAPAVESASTAKIDGERLREERGFGHYVRLFIGAPDEAEKTLGGYHEGHSRRDRIGDSPGTHAHVACGERCAHRTAPSPLRRTVVSPFGWLGFANARWPGEGGRRVAFGPWPEKLGEFSHPVHRAPR